MNIADTARLVIRSIHALSPYQWLDLHLKKKELASTDNTQAKAIRAQRLRVSERYIGYWLIAAIGIFLASPYLPGWSNWLLVPLLSLRILGILNKELGVILFGICKITEGTAVSASGRVIVLALTNYITALFLFATLYSMTGNFTDMPAWLHGKTLLAAILHAMTVHFSLSALLGFGNAATAWLSTAHIMFCFLFGTIVIALFVSLLNIRPLEK